MNPQRLHSFTLLLVPLFLLAALFAGCSSNVSQNSNSHSKTLTFSWSEDIGNLNPHTYLPNQFFTQAMVYESLVAYGEGGKIEPWLAEKWEMSPDGKEYLFHLRKDIKFSDGSTFNAAVVKKNFDAVLGNAKEHEWLELINQIKSTEVVDEFRFKMILKNSYYPALQELTLIRPLRFLGEAGFPDNGKTFEGIKKPIGTGPWVLSEYKRGEFATFTRNDLYWGTKPKINKIVVKVIPDGEARVLAFENKEIDLIFGNGLISQDSFKFLKDTGNYETHLSEPTSTRIVQLNSNRGATKDLKVRMAIQHAFNKQAVIDRVFYGLEKKSDTLFSTNFPYSDVHVKPYEYDVERAKQLLDEAGWKEVPGKEFREKDGKPLELQLLFISTHNIQKAVAEVIQGDLRKVGINVKLTGQEEEAHWKTAFQGEFELLFNESWGAPYDPHSYVSAMSKAAEQGNTDYLIQLGLPMKKDMDQKIGKVLLSTDENVRRALYADILTTLHEQAVYLPISYQSNMAVYHKNVSGVNFMPQPYEVPFTTIDVQ
ncbi:nickel ABC transporter substrate-binding protein [Brevibacillus fortis]|uniref:Nickel ABC transporter, nickel/metallophore periplasmic binding protein n=1 Tax=Brevibacillus fortis TaxID=2126352 RepID=A0A2P7V8I1_9BACL|nr:nickel ABC transporter substrate-binding protein [Brevibacillus fortis]PSJ95526.1 nickel ABC transporter, nickel/metallophore periplasmic binding protein [Brevibacillus fortis]